MPDKKHLLTSKQMARFVTDGFIQFDQVVPEEINRTAMEEVDKKTFNLWTGYSKSGTPLSKLWPESKGFGAAFRTPEVEGIIHSLVGPEPIYDHHAGHQVPPGTSGGQPLHQDAIIDIRTPFDIQLYYFPHDTPREMGGTMVIPGSHFRRVNTFEVSRYQNFVGQHRVVCKAGTIVATHMGIWHCAQPNRTDKTRYMFKLRLDPSVKQVRLWNTDDIDDPEIGRILNSSHGWYGNEGRIEIVQRIKLWRHLTGNDAYDTSLWLGRIENKPENLLAGV